MYNCKFLLLISYTGWCHPRNLVAFCKNCSCYNLKTNKIKHITVYIFKKGNFTRNLFRSSDFLLKVVFWGNWQKELKFLYNEVKHHINTEALFAISAHPLLVEIHSRGNMNKKLDYDQFKKTIETLCHGQEEEQADEQPSVCNLFKISRPCLALTFWIR